MQQDACLLLIFAAEADYELQAAAVLSGLKKPAVCFRNVDFWEFVWLPGLSGSFVTRDICILLYA